MSTQVPSPPAPAVQPAPPAPASKRSTRLRASDIGSRPQSRTSTRLRIAIAALVVSLVAAGGIAWLLTDQLIDETRRIDTSTGEVLIGNQAILASLAEADAAAVAVHLAGSDGDRVQRRTYEQALDRAAVGLEQVARVLGDDEPSHVALQEITTSLTSYAGLVESARARSIENVQPRANDELSQAIQVLREDISPNVELVSQRANGRFTKDSRSTWFVLAPIVLLVPLIMLLLTQRWLFVRFRRLINPPLALATIILALLIGWITSAGFVQQASLEEARVGAYESIEKTAELQSKAFRYRASDAERVIQQGRSDLINDRLAVEVLIDESVSLADSARERAAATEVQQRWFQYLGASADVGEAVADRDFELAGSLISGESNTAFTGFNTAVEGALFDNRAQFNAAVDSASSAMRWLSFAIPIGVVFAALLTWLGLSIRLREYR